MAESFSGPLVVCIRGASRSGKTTLCEALIAQLAPDLRVAWAKRTHHILDLPEKSSGRIWQSGPAAMVMLGPDRLQLTLPAREPTAAALFAALPPDIDVILLETHEPEAFATVLSEASEAVDGENLIGRFTLETAGADAARLAVIIRGMLPDDRVLPQMVRLAASAGEAHLCAEFVLGARLLIEGAGGLGVPLPGPGERLQIGVETAGCAAVSIQALAAKGAVRVRDYGKLAATFVDQETGHALRVAVRGEVSRALLGRGDEMAAATVHHLAGMEPEVLFTLQRMPPPQVRRGPTWPTTRHVTCARCGEEVFGGREVLNASGAHCRPCSAGPCVTSAKAKAVSSWR